MMDATRRLTTSAVDAGEKPAVISGIAKLHLTQRGREVVTDAMDVIGGKGIMDTTRRSNVRMRTG